MANPEDTGGPSVEKMLWPVITATSVLVALIGLAENIDKIQSIYSDHPTTILICALIFVLSLSWFSVHWLTNGKGALIKIISSIILICVWLLALFYFTIYPRAYDFSFTNCGPAKWWPHLGNLVTQASAAESSRNSLEVVGFSVDESRSSFYANEQTVTDDKHLTVVAFRQHMVDVFKDATCDNSFDPEAPIMEALPVWQELLNHRGQGEAEKIKDYESYKHLVQRGGAHGFSDLAPTRLEILELWKSDRPKFDILMNWLVNCVGLGDPVLIWTLKNNSASTGIITAVEYNVTAVGQVKGAAPEALEPIDVQPFDLVHKKGIQRQQLNPNVKVPPKETAQIRILYRLDPTDWGYTWDLTARFTTIEGQRAESKPFQFVAAKGPQIK